MMTATVNMNIRKMHNLLKEKKQQHGMTTAKRSLISLNF